MTGIYIFTFVNLLFIYYQQNTQFSGFVKGLQALFDPLCKDDNGRFTKVPRYT